MSQGSFHTPTSQEHNISHFSQSSSQNNSQYNQFNPTSLEISPTEYFSSVSNNDESFLSPQYHSQPVEPVQFPPLSQRSVASEHSQPQNNSQNNFNSFQQTPYRHPSSFEETPIQPNLDILNDCHDDPMSVDIAEDDRAASAAAAASDEDPNLWGVLKPLSKDKESVSLKDKLPGTAKDGAKRGGGYLFGRHNECDVRFQNPQISNRHCLIFKVGFVILT